MIRKDRPWWCLVLTGGIALLYSITIVQSSAAVADTISSQISDVAMVKPLLLDRGTNILHMGWDDRDNANYPCGQARISELVERVIRKHGHKTSGEDFFLSVFGLKRVEKLPPKDVEALAKRISAEALDIPSTVSTEGSADKDGCYISYTIPDRAYRLIIWPKGSKLPDVKFGPGTLRFTFNSATVSFTDGTKCILRGKTYVYGSGTWLKQ